MTNEQCLKVKERFPNAPETVEELASFHDLLYSMDNSLLHLSGIGFVSVRYPNGEVYVFRTDGESLRFKF